MLEHSQGRSKYFGGLKTPGPDGYSAIFFKRCWSIDCIVGDELVGPKTNFQKSSIHFSKRVSPDNKKKIADKLVLRIMHENEKYLGVYLLKSDKQIASYNFLDEKMTNKMAGWKRHFLNPAGRTNLIQGVLALIPSYYMACNLVPKKVLARMVRIMRSFWWGHSTDKKKMHFIAWDKLCNHKAQGGLKIRNLEDVNKALIGKLIWRFLTEEDSLWVEILSAKYLKGVNFWDCKAPNVCSSIWDAILTIRPLMEEGCCWQVGDGKSISIYKDPWVPRLHGYKLIGSDDNGHSISKVEDLISSSGTEWNLNLINSHFSRLEAQSISDIYISPELGTDKLLWILSKKGMFTTKSFHKLLADKKGTTSYDPNSLFEWHKFWKLKEFPPKVQIFIWRVLHNGIAVLANIGRFIKNYDKDCRLCGGDSETINHLFLHYPVTQAFLFASPLGIKAQNLQQSSIRDLMVSLLNIRDGGDSFRYCACLMWCWWKARNRLVYEGIKPFFPVVIIEASKLFDSYKPAQYNDTQAAIHLTDQSSCAWSPPENNVIKINVDAGCKDGFSATAVVARNSDSSCTGCSSTHLHIANPVVAETMGVLHGVQYAY